MFPLVAREKKIRFLVGERESKGQTGVRSLGSQAKKKLEDPNGTQKVRQRLMRIRTSAINEWIWSDQKEGGSKMSAGIADQMEFSWGTG